MNGLEDYMSGVCPDQNLEGGSGPNKQRWPD